MIFNFLPSANRLPHHQGWERPVIITELFHLTEPILRLNGTEQVLLPVSARLCLPQQHLCSTVPSSRDAEPLPPILGMPQSQMSCTPSDPDQCPISTKASLIPSCNYTLTSKHLWNFLCSLFLLFTDPHIVLQQYAYKSIISSPQRPGLCSHSSDPLDWVDSVKLSDRVNSQLAVEGAPELSGVHSNRESREGGGGRQTEDRRFLTEHQAIQMPDRKDEIEDTWK